MKERLLTDNSRLLTSATKKEFPLTEMRKTEGRTDFKARIQRF